MPSLYLGCTIEDELTEGLIQFNKSLEEARQTALADIAALDTLLTSLSTSAAKASLTIGDAAKDNRIKWEAVAEGDDGNKVGIFYEYLGPIPNPLVPGGFDPRPPSAYVSSNVVHCILPVAANATINQSVATCLPLWLSGTGVSSLVTGSLVDPGAGFPEPNGLVYLGGGKGSPIPEAEQSANSVARVFGKQSYPTFLKNAGICAIETPQDAISFVENLGGNCIFVNGRMFFVEGTNLVGINKLYELVAKDLTKLKELLSAMTAFSSMPYLAITENVSTTTYEFICNAMQPLVTVTETFRDWDKNIEKVAKTWTGGDVSVLNPYVFWSVELSTGVAPSTKLQTLGIPSEYFVSIFNGETAEQSPTSSVKPPEVFTIEDPELFSKLGLSDADIVALLEKGIAGVRLPQNTSIKDIAKQFNKLAGTNRTTQASGFKCKVQTPLALAQAADLSKTFNESDKLKELVARGGACARLGQPVLDIPSVNLDDASKKLEAAFAALSSAIKSALKVFDKVFDALKKVFTTFVNKMQNLSSLAENLFKNDLAKCLLGVGGPTTGFIDPTKIGPGTGKGSGGLGDGPTAFTSGLPMPTMTFGLFMQKLAAKLEQSIYSAFDKVMKSIAVPLCLAQQLITAITSMSLGSINPCLKGKDLDSKCPPPEVQDLLNESAIGSDVNSLPQMMGEPTSTSSSGQGKNLIALTGQAREYPYQVKETVVRGIQTIVDELSTSINTKLQFVDEIFLSIKRMMSGSQELKLSLKEALDANQRCLPPSVGLLSDTIMKYI